MKLLKLLFCSLKKGINRDRCVPATGFGSLSHIANPERAQKRNPYFGQYSLWNLQKQQHFLLSEFICVISGPLHSLCSRLGFVFWNKGAFSRTYSQFISGSWGICFPPHPVCCDIVSSNYVTWVYFINHITQIRWMGLLNFVCCCQWVSLAFLGLGFL